MGVSGDFILLLQNASESLLLNPAIESSASSMLETVITMYGGELL
jgi:hypothetical protein